MTNSADNIAGKDSSVLNTHHMLSDHGFDQIEDRGLVYPLGEYRPEYGNYFELMPGIGWTRTPVPGPLGHINNWILADRDAHGEGVAIIDTGLFLPETVAAWEKLFSNDLQGVRVTRVIVTHFHPDHLGMAGWLCEKFAAPLWMNRTEWLMAKVFLAEMSAPIPPEAIALWRFSGWDDALIEKMREVGWGIFGDAVAPLPAGHVRMQEDQILHLNGGEWRVVIGSGHTPEHVCLLNENINVMISGDQILPRITSNVSVMLTEPMADPMGEWLESIAKLQIMLDPDLLVLPAHGRPFKGALHRLETLAKRHRDALHALEMALAEKPMRVIDCFPILFSRPVGNSVVMLATGEALANLKHLEMTGLIRYEMREGVAWYRATSTRT